MSRLLRPLSRISIRLLAFNILLVFLPALGFLSLEVYERQLRELQERSMVQQGRLLAAALGDRGDLDGRYAEKILVNMEQHFEARLRVIGMDRSLLADSSGLGPRGDQGEIEDDDQIEVRSTPLYRLGNTLYRLVFGPPDQPPRESSFRAIDGKLDGPEIAKALSGVYGANTRKSSGGQRSLTLYSALPIRDHDRVVGAVLVSQSTLQILSSLYEMRLDTFKIVLASVGAAAVLSLLVSTTIARPLDRLRREAREVLDRRGRLRRHFAPSKRSDEIGDLSQALAELTRRLENHIQFIEAFASDVSHEFKNPLAAIRNTLELLDGDVRPTDKKRFIDMAFKDLAHLERLLAGVREITQIDADLDVDRRTPVELKELMQALIERFELQSPGGPSYTISSPDQPVVVSAAPERIAQIFENVLDNATSFSTPDDIVEVELETRGSSAHVTIRDSGPGIPEEHLDQIFKRFFTYRPTSPDGHTGLGLAIVKALVEGYGGTIRASNRAAGGTEVEVTFQMSTSNSA